MKVNIKFQTEPDTAKALVATKLCQASFLYINLPDEITIEFVNLGDSIHGETSLNRLSTNTIRISNKLLVNEIVEPLIHELIHVSQIHEGRLTVSRGGNIIWEGKMHRVEQTRISFKEYRNLPWELEAFYKQKELLDKLLNDNC